jgi:type III pantothenate kinase
MTLLIDLGNTRLKWALLKADGTLSTQHAAVHRGWQSQDFAQALAKSLRRKPAVWIVSVAAPAVQAKLTRALKTLAIPHVHFIETTVACAGVRNGYREPWRLGVDRWVALIGARARAPKRAVVVADVGTAVTLDILRRDGQHWGGVIVPGVELMQQSLLRSTGGIRRRAGGATGRARATHGVSWQAQSTAEAIQYGAQLAAAAVIDAAYAEHRALRPHLLVTGGGATALHGLIKSPCEYVPDLVLQGLVQVVRAGGKG